MGFVPKEATADWVVQYWDNNACVLRTKIFGKFETAKNWATNSMNDSSIDNAIVMRVHYALYKEMKVVVVDNEVSETRKTIEQEDRVCGTCMHRDVLCCDEPCLGCYDHVLNQHAHWEARSD